MALQYRPRDDLRKEAGEGSWVTTNGLEKGEKVVEDVVAMAG